MLDFMGQFVYIGVHKAVVMFIHFIQFGVPPVRFGTVWGPPCTVWGWPALPAETFVLVSAGGVRQGSWFSEASLLAHVSWRRSCLGPGVGLPPGVRGPRHGRGVTDENDAGEISMATAQG